MASVATLPYWCHSCTSQVQLPSDSDHCPQCQGEFLEAIDESNGADEGGSSHAGESSGHNVPQILPQVNHLASLFQLLSQNIQAPSDSETEGYSSASEFGPVMFSMGVQGNGVPLGLLENMLVLRGERRSGAEFSFGFPLAGSAGDYVAGNGEMQNILNRLFQQHLASQKRPADENAVSALKRFVVNDEGEVIPKSDNVRTSIPPESELRGKGSSPRFQQNGSKRLRIDDGVEFSSSVAKNQEECLSSVQDMQRGDEGLKPLSEECAVCMSNFEVHDELIMMTCRHLFHESCLLPWFEEKNNCPVCRTEIAAKVNTSDSLSRSNSTTDVANRTPSLSFSPIYSPPTFSNPSSQSAPTSPSPSSSSSSSAPSPLPLSTSAEMDSYPEPSGSTSPNHNTCIIS